MKDFALIWQYSHQYCELNTYKMCDTVCAAPNKLDHSHEQSRFHPGHRGWIQSQMSKWIQEKLKYVYVSSLVPTNQHPKGNGDDVN